MTNILYGNYFKPKRRNLYTYGMDKGTLMRGTTTLLNNVYSTLTNPMSENNDFESQVAILVNQERANVGLPPLELINQISEVARIKGRDLRDRNYFSHQSPIYGSPFDMLEAFGIRYSYAGENIAKGQRTPKAVMNGWMDSPGHKENILNSNYKEIGVGFVKDTNDTNYWVQLFVTR